MNSKKIIKPLAIIFVISGIWDLIAAVFYFFFIGLGRQIDVPPIDPFFSIFLGSFLVCFSFLQLLSSYNIELYAFNVGCLIIGRMFYVIQLYSYMLFVQNFPSTFWFTGLVDSLFIILYLIFAFRSGLKLQDLFLPKGESLSY